MDYFEDSKNIVRAVIILLLFGCMTLAKLITKKIGNTRLSKLFNSLFKFLVILIILRISAAWLDYYLDPQLSIFSSMVGISPHVYIFYLLYRFNSNLKHMKEDIHATDGSIIYSNQTEKQKLSKVIDSLFDELQMNQKKTETLHNSLERELKNL